MSILYAASSKSAVDQIIYPLIPPATIFKMKVRILHQLSQITLVQLVQERRSQLGLHSVWNKIVFENPGCTLRSATDKSNQDNDVEYLSKMERRVSNCQLSYTKLSWTNTDLERLIGLGYASEMSLKIDVEDNASTWDHASETASRFKR